MKPQTQKYKIVFIEELLGTKTANPDLYREYLADKIGVDEQEKELEALPKNLTEEEKKNTTVFPRTEDGLPFIYDYQIKGFFKDAQGMLQRVKGEKMTAYKKIIDGLIFIKERKIPLALPENGNITVCTRPLRAQTMQGERVSLANSEAVPAGSVAEFTVECFDPDLFGKIETWLEYGRRRGLGQWRNSGKGAFEYFEGE